MQKPIKKATIILWIIGGVILLGSLISIGSNAEAAAGGIVTALILGLIGFLIGRKKSEKAEAAEAAPVKAQSKQPSVIREMDVEVWGTRYTNEDKTSRQTYVAKLKEGEDLFFHPAPTDEYPDTIGVFTAKREQIGFVDYKTLNELRGLYANNKASVSVKEVTHSERGLGVIMHIKIYE